MILVFDTFGGLCNQMMDISSAINFCIEYNISFTFRECCFRNKDLISWYPMKFSKLFDASFLQNYSSLYIDFSYCNLTQYNTFNFDGKLVSRMFTCNFEQELQNVSQTYVILKQFSSVFDDSQTKINIYPSIRPSKRLLTLYTTIRDKLLQENEPYNCIHYRYESDFTRYFRLTNLESLESVLMRLKRRFANPNLKIYLATSNVTTILDVRNKRIANFILYKPEEALREYNYEELAFVDYMFGLHSQEIFGHSQSSFSNSLNRLKQTENYYNIHIPKRFWKRVVYC